MEGESQLIIKAGSVQNLTDARYFASKQVDWVGFCFDKASGSFIAPPQAQEIIKWLEGPKFVGEFTDQPLAEVRQTAMILGLDFVQLGEHYLAQDLSSLDQPIIQEFKPTQAEALTEILQRVTNEKEPFDYVMLDLSALSLEAQALIDFYTSVNQVKPTLLDIDFDEALLDQLLTVQPFGINLVGGTEERIGAKSFEELDKLFELLQDEL